MELSMSDAAAKTTVRPDPAEERVRYLLKPLGIRALAAACLMVKPKTQTS